MSKFEELTTPKEVIDYQKMVLSRTGGRSSDEAQLYHYTNIKSAIFIIRSGYMWLSPARGMNDILEEKILAASGLDNLHYACFSRTNENLAMFKMYAPNPDGVMLSISLADARRMLEQKTKLVENGKYLDAALKSEKSSH